MAEAMEVEKRVERLELAYEFVGQQVAQLGNQMEGLRRDLKETEQAVRAEIGGLRLTPLLLLKLGALMIVAVWGSWRTLGCVR